MKDILVKMMSAAMAVMVACMPVYADKSVDYKKFAEETAEWVYSLDLPAFDVREIPEEYKNESAVYLAVYNYLEVIRCSESSRVPGTLRYASDKRIEGVELDRKLIYINDKSALDEFSEYDYLANVTGKHGTAQKKYRQVIGVKVIKPDGTERIVDTDDYIEVKEDKKGKRMRRKLAVPGLEVGDIIDVFVCVKSDINNAHFDPMLFVLREQYPVVNYSVCWILDSTLASSFRQLNDAPDFTGTHNAQNTYRLDLTMTDLPARPRLYYDDILQSPAVKLYIYNPDAEQFVPKSSKMVGLYGAPFAFYIKKEYLDLQAEVGEYKGMGREFLKSALKNGGKAVGTLKQMLKSGEKSLTDVSDCAYNLMVFAHAVSDESNSPILFDMRMQSVLKEFVGDSLETVMTTAASDEPVYMVASIYNIKTGCMLPGGKRYYFPPYAFMSPTELHTEYAGRPAQKWSISKLDDIEAEADTVYFNLPEGRARQNSKHSRINVKIDGSDLVINRRTSCAGAAKESVMQLVTSEDLTKAYLDYFDKCGLDVAIKENGKKAADRQAHMEDRRIEQEEDFESEAKDFHGSVAVDSIKGSIISVGIDPKSPKFVYEVSYNAHDLVKKAGRNMLLSVGVLLENSVELLESDRKRDDYITTTAAREYVTRIELALPDGKTVSEKSLQGLERNVVNSAGTFSAVAKVVDGRLIVDVIKRFDHRFLPVTAWADMMELLDTASSWHAATILIE